MYKQSIEDPSTFWGNIASQFYWKRKWDTSKPICSYNFDIRQGPVSIEWFKGGYTNICYNALDKHVNEGRGDNVAILWEGNQVGQELRLTYRDVLKKTCQLANYLRKRGVKKGDRVCIYMPMVPELPIAMLACARIGAIHSVVFGGFSAESLAGRILDCKSDVLLSCSAVQRGNKALNLKAIVDEALMLCKQKENFTPGTCLIYDNANAVPRSKVNWVAGRDLWWQDEVRSCSTEAPVEWMEAEDPLFLLYTSGSTGKPKGVLHTVGGYMVYAATTFKYVFDYQPGDVFWCTADCGWITGHTYICYGPMLNGATQVVFEGVPMYPSPSRWWEIIEKYKVSIFYTAPTAIRSLEALGDKHVIKHDRSSLRLLGTVGEAINAKAWLWYHRVVGEGRCPIVDTWWQTETGGIMITPLPGAWCLKPGSATLPFFGVEPVVLDQEGKPQDGPCAGYLCIKGAWPGMARTLYGDHQRFAETYFTTWPGYYVTGDGCQREANGYITLTGRVDDVVNVSGHRISIGEVESALTSHKSCAETAAVAFDHDVKGQGIYAFVTLVEGVSPTEKLKDEIKAAVRREIGSFAVPDVIQWAPGLPKTRSGKIMRRILRKIAANQFNELGDTSSLADPAVVDQLVETKRGNTRISKL
ncbi:hypothetical protein M758_3G262400 [Ceratodon purpureus]|nr:hypothetical protein KC19_3G261800 [Ceratodon purpureus]KAG0624629.1 hypothetical protein M758_3G262400 [Ceratodon purpureus]